MATQSLRQLGKSDVSITPIILGTWAIGGEMWGGTNEQDSLEAIQTSLDQGVITIDTAPAYGFGYSEQMVGKALKGKRDRAIIATKCGLRWKQILNPVPNSPRDLDGHPIIIEKNSTPKSIIFECEESLKRLNTDVIDLYQIHWPDPNTPIEESWEAMAKLKQQGKVRAIGVSNYNLEQLQQAHAVHPVDSVQLPYSLIRRGIEQEIVPFCAKQQIAILAYSSLERGLLTGAVDMKRTFSKGDHRQAYDLFSNENRKKISSALEKLHPITQAHECTIAQAIISCTMNLPQITGVLVGARNATQAKENGNALKLQLSPSEHRLIIDALTHADIELKT